MQWLLCNKEIIEMITNMAIAFAVGISAIALFYSGSAFRLQGKALRANLFNDISSRIRQLEDQWAQCKEEKDRKMWYERLFNAFEYFAFLANHGSISSEMKEYYKSGIKIYVDRLITKKEYLSLFEEYKKRPKEQFSELRKYYKNEIKKELPF